MIQLAICDDVPMHMTQVLKLLDMYSAERPGIEMSTHCYDSGSVLIAELNEGRAFDAYFLDILMPEADGISIAKQIRLNDKNVPIVFLTISTGHALDAFSVSATQYILKPVDKDELFAVLDKIVAEQKHESEKFFTLSSKGCIFNLLYSSIVMVEYAGRALCFHLTNCETVESKVIRTPFGHAVAELLDDSRFLWVHQSFVINMAQVAELRRRSFLMSNGVDVSVPRPKYADVKRAYLRFLADKSRGF